MAVQAEDSVDIDFAKGYAECIAQVANAWAALEYSINECIWALADTTPALGACLTAQIVSLNGRLNALLALMKHREVDPGLISRVNKFAEKSRGPAELRNRIIHDVWMQITNDPNMMGQLTITASMKLEFSLQDRQLSELVNNVRTIITCRNEAMKIRMDVFSALSTLPEIPHPRLYPITSSRPVP